MVNVVDKQCFEKAPGDVSLVRHEFSAVIDNDVQFETEEPIHSPFAACGKSPKGFMPSRSFVVTHPNGE